MSLPGFTTVWRPRLFISRLVQYRRHAQDGQPPAGYRSTPVHWWLDLEDGGKVLRLSRTASGRGPRGRKVGVSWPIPYVKLTNNVRARPLADKASHVFGLHPPSVGGIARARAVLGHTAFRDLVLRCAAQTGHPAVEAVAKFSQHASQVAAQLPSALETGDMCAFRVDGRPVVDLPQVQDWWQETQDQGPKASCLVCGEVRAIARVHPQVQGIPGALATGAVLVSANRAAFESYGLSQGHGARVCHRCAQAYTQALNHLLQSESHRMTLRESGAVVLAWRPDGEASDLLSTLTRPDPAAVQNLLQGKGPQPQDAVLCVAVLSAAGGRVILRDFFETALPKAAKSLAAFFHAQEPPQTEADLSYASPEDLERAVVHASGQRRRQREGLRAPAYMSPALARFALAGTPLPKAMGVMAARRASILYACDILEDPRLEEALVTLVRMTLGAAGRQGVERSAPFLAGRLLALADAALAGQAGPGNRRPALRFFGAAAARPAATLAYLSRHAAERGGHPLIVQRVRHEAQRLQDTMGPVPDRLTLEEQGPFVLGFHCQRHELIHALGLVHGEARTA